MGWIEKQDTPLGRVGFIGYSGRFILRLAVAVVVGSAIIAVIRLVIQAAI